MTTTNRVLVIDPGERTGWASALIRDGEIVEVDQGVHPLKDFALGLADGIHKYDTVVYETWRLFEDKAKDFIGNDFQPVQLIGMIRLLCWLNPTIEVVTKPPKCKSYGRTVMPEILSRRLEHSTEEHDKDALDLLSHYWFVRYA
jgi:hypothetical protein